MEKLNLEFKPFLKGGDIEKQREAFEKGKQDFLEGKVKLDNVKIYWVKKCVRITDWKNWYSQDITYCPLQRSDEGMWIGFLSVNQIPFDCSECNNEEVMLIDNYRRSKNIRPFPCEAVENLTKDT